MGSTLLKWRLDALLGVGGMAAVYAGTHLKNRSRVALKVLHRELAANQEIRDRFLREAYVANSVDHEGAVDVREDYLSENDEPVLVMELLRGKTLDGIQAEKGTLTEAEVLSYTDQVLDVIAAAHDKGIVHRDIKPQNLFLTTKGRVKVLDFGVARMLEGAASATLTGSLLGTPAFMPPEQASGRTSAICARSDLWSVGATMFTLLSGRFVHEAENAQAHTIKAAVTRARSLGSVLPGADRALIAIVDRALAFEITDRFPDARAMRSEVRRLRRITLSTPARSEEDEEPSDEMSTYPRGIGVIAGSPRQSSSPEVAPIEPKRTPPDPSEDDDDDDATSVVKRDQLRAHVPVPAPRAPLQLAEPPTLAPRGASPPKDAPAPSAMPVPGLVDDGATTSVIVVPPPAFAPRPSSPGIPPGPPPPDVAAFSFEPSPAVGLAKTEVAPLEPSGFTDKTVPLRGLDSSLSDDPTDVLPTGPLPMAGGSGRDLFRDGALVAGNPADPRKARPRESFPGGVPLVPSPSPADQTTPLGTAPDQARSALPTLDLHASTTVGVPSGPSPETISVSAQAISQATPPARRRGPKIGRSELYAIGGALVAILIVSYVVLKAVLGGSSAPDGSGAAASVPASAASETGAPTAFSAPAPTAAAAPSTATEGPSTASSTNTTAPDPSSTGSAAPKPSAPKPPVYRPPTDPLSHWPKTKKTTNKPAGK